MQQLADFKDIHFWEREEQYYFNQLYASQGRVVTFSRYGRQVHNHFCQISSGFCVSKIIKISSFLAEMIEKY